MLNLSIHTDKHIKDANGASGYSYSYYKMLEHFPKFSYRNEKMNVLDTTTGKLFFLNLIH